MKAIFIVLPILAALLLLLFGRIRIRLSYDGGFALTIRYLFLRFRLYPRKKKKPKPDKEKKKALKKQAKKDKKKTERKDASKKRRLRLGDIRFLLRIARETLGSILSHASRHVRIRIRTLCLRIGGEEDAARAAIEYGLIAQAVSYSLAYLDDTCFLVKPRRGAIDIGVAFTERGHSLRLAAEVTCPLVFLVPLAISSLMKAMTARGRWVRYRARSNNRKKNNADTLKKEK